MQHQKRTKEHDCFICHLEVVCYKTHPNSKEIFWGRKPLFSMYWKSSYSSLKWILYSVHASMLHFRTCGNVGPSWCSFRNTRYSPACFDFFPSHLKHPSLLWPLVLSREPDCPEWQVVPKTGPCSGRILQNQAQQISVALSSEFTATRLAGWPWLYLWLPAWLVVLVFSGTCW